MRRIIVNILLLMTIVTALPSGRDKRHLSYVRNFVSALFGGDQGQLQPYLTLPVHKESETKHYRIPGYNNLVIKCSPKTTVIEENDITAARALDIQPFESYIGTKNAQDTLVALQNVNELMSTGLLEDDQSLLKETLVPMYKDTVRAIAKDMGPVLEIINPVVPLSVDSSNVKVGVPSLKTFSYKPSVTNGHNPVNQWSSSNLETHPDAALFTPFKVNFNDKPVSKNRVLSPIQTSLVDFNRPTQGPKLYTPNTKSSIKNGSMQTTPKSNPVNNKNDEGNDPNFVKDKDIAKFVGDVINAVKSSKEVLNIIDPILNSTNSSKVDKLHSNGHSSQNKLIKEKDQIVAMSPIANGTPGILNGLNETLAHFIYTHIKIPQSNKSSNANEHQPKSNITNDPKLSLIDSKKKTELADIENTNIDKTRIMDQKINSNKDELNTKVNDSKLPSNPSPINSDLDDLDNDIESYSQGLSLSITEKNEDESRINVNTELPIKNNDNNINTKQPTELTDTIPTNAKISHSVIEKDSYNAIPGILSEGKKNDEHKSKIESDFIPVTKLDSVSTDSTIEETELLTSEAIGTTESDGAFTFEDSNQALKENKIIPLVNDSLNDKDTDGTKDALKKNTDGDLVNDNNNNLQDRGDVPE